MYRLLSLATLATASALSLAGPVTTAAAGSIQDTYCVQGRQSGYPGNCEFSNYHQCMATASGAGEGCGINPMTAYARPYRGENQGRY